MIYSSDTLLNVYLSRLDLSTEKVNTLGLHDDSISSMTFVRSTSKTLLFLSKYIYFFLAAVIHIETLL